MPLLSLLASLTNIAFGYSATAPSDDKFLHRRLRRSLFLLWLLLFFCDKEGDGFASSVVLLDSLRILVKRWKCSYMSSLGPVSLKNFVRVTGFDLTQSVRCVPRPR